MKRGKMLQPGPCKIPGGHTRSRACHMSLRSSSLIRACNDPAPPVRKPTWPVEIATNDMDKKAILDCFSRAAYAVPSRVHVSTRLSACLRKSMGAMPCGGKGQLASAIVRLNCEACLDRSNCGCLCLRQDLTDFDAFTSSVPMAVAKETSTRSVNASWQLCTTHGVRAHDCQIQDAVHQQGGGSEHATTPQRPHMLDANKYA